MASSDSDVWSPAGDAVKTILEDIERANKKKFRGRNGLILTPDAAIQKFFVSHLLPEMRQDEVMTTFKIGSFFSPSKIALEDEFDLNLIFELQPEPDQGMMKVARSDHHPAFAQVIGQPGRKAAKAFFERSDRGGRGRQLNSRKVKDTLRRILAKALREQTVQGHASILGLKVKLIRRGPVNALTFELKDQTVTVDVVPAFTFPIESREVRNFFCPKIRDSGEDFLLLPKARGYQGPNTLWRFFVRVSGRLIAFG